jgi:hypothetical protein
MKTPFASFPASVVETLEPRLAPAGTILLTTAGGVLTITGDTAANGIQITDVPGSGEWQINDFGGLTTTFILNGVETVAGFNIPAQNAIKATLGDGSDEMRILPSGTPSSMLLPGGISINAGKGNDEVYLGSNSSQFLMVGAVNVDLGEGDDTFDSTLSGTYSGAVKILGGLGNDTVRIEGVSADQVFLKGLTVDVGKGDNTVVLDAFRLAVAGALTVIDAGDAALTPAITLSADTLTVDGAVSISVAAGTSSIVIGDEVTDVQQFGAGLRITGGTGNDSVSFMGIQTIAGAVTVDLKAGSNQTTFVTGSSFAAASLAILGSTGTDGVLIDNNAEVLVNAGFTVNLGGGANTWTTDPGAQFMSGTFTYLGGTGNDTIDFSGTDFRVLGAMTINTGTDGTSNVNLDPSSSAYVGGLLTVIGGKGTENISIDSPDFRIGAGLRASLGEGTNSLVTQGALLQVVGGVAYTAGAGSDTLLFLNDSLIVSKAVSFNSAGAGTNFLYFAGVTGSIGSVSYLGGTGADVLYLGNVDGTTTTRLTVNGALTGNFGSGQATVLLADSQVQGVVNLTMAGKSTESDSVTLYQSVFNSAVNINMGAGASDASFRDVFVRGNFTLNTGAGDDNVELETVADDGESYWFGLVKIMTGAGADTIAIGTNPAVPDAANNFYRNVFVDGGVDSDSLAPAQPGSNNFVAGATLTQLNFP